ncbi:MAG: thioredoxin family protein [Bacteroidetes bacterium]|nr:thioredoxin family protein [Bacteroidota bacterium]
MKKLLLLALFAFLVFSVNAQNSTEEYKGIRFETGTIAEIYTKAKKENKPIFVDVYTTWCGPCKWLAKNVFTNDTVARFYNEKFICYSIDAEKGEGLSFAKEYKISAYPSLLFLDSTGRVLRRAVGGRAVKEFVALGEKALDPEQRLTVWQDKYASGKRDPEFIRPYIDELAEAGMYEEQTEIIFWYFYALSEREWITKENFEVINKHCRNSEGQGFQNLLKNREKFHAVVGKEKVDKKIYDVFYGDLLRRYVEYKIVDGKYEASINEEKYKAAIDQIKNSGLERADELIMYANISYFEIKGDMKKYMELKDTYINKYKMNDWNHLNGAAWDVYENEKITDKKSLQKALAWIKRSVELESNYYNNDTEAALLYKMKNKKEAIKAAEKAIELAKKDGADASVTEELLEKIKKMK